MSILSLENIHVKFELRSFNRFELSAFNAQKFRGHVTLATPPFGKILRVISGLSLETCTSNLKSVALTVLSY